MKYSKVGGKSTGSTRDHGAPRTNADTVNDAPEGYPRLARFIATSEDNYVFREFRYLQSRVLLHLQDDLRSWEARLWRMDEYDRVHRPFYLTSRETDDADSGKRGKMIGEIHERLLKYG